MARHFPTVPNLLSQSLTLSCLAAVFAAHLVLLPRAHYVALLFALPLVYPARVLSLWFTSVTAAAVVVLETIDLAGGGAGTGSLLTFAVLVALTYQVFASTRRASAMARLRDLARMEGRDYFYWDEANSTRMGRYLADREATFIRSALNDFPDVRRVFDVGAGTGRFARHLARRGYDIIASETRMYLVRMLSEVGIPSLLVNEEAASLPVVDGAVDCVLCMEVFPVSREPWFWSECARVLNEHGIVIAVVDNARSYKSLLQRVLHPRTRYRAYRLPFDNVRASVEAAGLRVVREHGLNWLPLSRASDSPLVGPGAAVEQLLRLPKRTAFSPWVLVAAEKLPSLASPENLSIGSELANGISQRRAAVSHVRSSLLARPVLPDSLA